ncbi:MAG: hypothetical protein Ct9H300mP2_5350 [Candidatus Neomarinimicrobiota bacterium]|nr:MAG: hypothetical protein Ct9H300mP2_5350 [Candidatus Neomarinimicrobiota bacterium]
MAQAQALRAVSSNNNWHLRQMGFSTLIKTAREKVNVWDFHILPLRLPFVIIG